MLDISVNGNAQPFLLTTPHLLAEIMVLVILLQAQVVTTEVTLQRVLVKENLFAAQEAGVELFEEEISRGRLHVVVKLRCETAMVSSHVTVKPPLLAENRLATDKPALQNH